jgi:ketosteroid isomerase-like protein
MKNRIALLVILFFGIGLSTLFAQEWTAAQKEVWKNVNDYWSLLAKGDVNGFAEYVHPDYIGWDDNSPLPATKEESKKELTYYMQGTKMPLFTIKPLAIKIYGDVAFVHYYFSYVQEMQDGKKKSEKGRWTDILLKQGTRWVLIGDNGGSGKED